MKIAICKCKNISHPLPLFAWAIMFLQKMKPWQKNAWSHMAIKFVFKGKVFYVDANSKGTMMRDADQFYKQYEVIESHQLSKEINYDEFIEWFSHLNGNKYDWKQIFGLLIKLIGLKKFNYSGHGYKKLICCELIINYFNKFERLYVKDSDDFDLITTWKIAKQL